MIRSRMRFALALLLLTTPALAYELPFGCGDSDQCRPVQVREKGTGWHAFYRGRWTAIPYEKVVPIRSPDGSAYLCSNRCFIRPYM